MRNKYLRSSGYLVGFAVTIVLAIGHPLVRAADFEEEPINYNTATAANPIQRLQDRIKTGQVTLDRNSHQGYLPSLLKELKIPISSQTLVFSRTSFQRERISPRRPRALYFNDDVYLGWVEGGKIIEVAAADPHVGVAFYTLDQGEADRRDSARPALLRQSDSCLQCHAGPITRDEPGLMLRSVFPDRTGQPILAAGTFLTTQESELKDRWGGWYVTGTHGDQRHMGNVTLQGDANPDDLDREAGANLTDLTGKFDTSTYLSGHSDIVALMVLEHQVEMHNLIARANFGVRRAMYDAAAMNKSLGRPAGYVSESTTSRIKSVCDPLVKYMLFCNEAKLTAPVAGTTSFASDYAAAGLRDKAGRSLRDLDLKTRLLKYPCSPLIYSEAFDGLPPEARQYVSQRLTEILSGNAKGTEFDHLAHSDREAILGILRDTKPGLLQKTRMTKFE